MGHIQLLASGTFIFGDSATPQELLLAIGIFVLDLISISSLFCNKSTYKIIGNIILHIMCIIDISYCINFIIGNVDSSHMIIEIIIDVAFMILIIYDIIKSNKEYVDTSDKKFFKEQ